MDKESIIELQKLDSNCNDCIFLVRDAEKFKKSLEDHERWQLDYFNTIKQNLLDKADWYDDKTKPKYNPKKAENLRKEAAKLRFQFTRKGCVINYGRCDKFDKDVSFIPNVLQLDTQDCFKHRRE